MDWKPWLQIDNEEYLRNMKIKKEMKNTIYIVKVESYEMEIFKVGVVYDSMIRLGIMKTVSNG